MLDDQEFETLSRNLMPALGDLAQLRKERTRLLTAGDAGGADQLNVTLNDRSAQILALSVILMVEAKVNDEQNLTRPVSLLLQNSQLAPGKAGRPYEMEHLWNAAFMVGLATIAAAGVGAPLAALATGQPIGVKILEDAIATFASVALVEATIEVKAHLRNHHQERAEQGQPGQVAVVGKPGVEVGVEGRVGIF